VGARVLLLLAPLLLGLSGAGRAQTWVLSRGVDLERGLRQPAWVLHDPDRRLLYVSNLNGEPRQREIQGYISRVSMQGRVVDPAWVTGLRDPRGMALGKGRLYVATEHTLVAVDPDRGTVVARYPAPAARQLRGVAVDGTGRVYVSDTLTNAIYRLHDGALRLWLRSPALESPTGLLAEDGHLLVATWGARTLGFQTRTAGHLKTVDLHTRRIATLGDGTPLGHLEGLCPDGRGGYYVTDRADGTLLDIAADGRPTTLLDLAPGSAGLEYVPALSLLLIPMESSDRVITYLSH